MATIRHVLELRDLTEDEVQRLLRDAQREKRASRRSPRALAGRTVALVFQRPSMRTRVAFEVAVRQLGGSVVSLSQEDVQLGARESAKDAARVLSRYVDAIVARLVSHQDVQELARHATVPVINGLSDLAHPCQALADLLTIQEQFGRLKGLRLGYVGDGNNVLHSLLEGCAMCGVHVAVATPDGFRPNGAIWRQAATRAASRGGQFSRAASPREAVRGADIVYTDVWVSMGTEAERAKRRAAFRGYQVNRALLKLAKRGCRVMHCLPAHRGEEITEEVLEGRHSVVFDQAENRLHVQKALLKFLLRSR